MVSFVFVALNHQVLFALLIVIFAFQSMSNTGMLTSILSIITIEKGDTGYYFAFQFIAFQVSYVVGELAFRVTELESKKIYIYFMIILLFMFVSVYLYRNLPEDHDEVYQTNFQLWLKIIKVKVTPT